MSNNRPSELNEYLEKSTEQNDLKIATALERIEEPKNWDTLKPTVSTICHLTDLSRNTIRNRQWALERLKSIKQKRKDARNASKNNPVTAEEMPSLPDILRSRIKALLEQNVLLYQEVISLQKLIHKKELEIKELSKQRRP